jgi:carboxylesterase
LSAEPPVAGALLLHGLTGSPQSLGSLPRALAGAGFQVEVPVLAGHCTTLAALEGTGWEDWVGSAERAYARLAAACERVVLVGLSMGGALACWLAADHPEVAGLVAVNPFIDPPAESFREAVRGVIAAGFPRAPAITGDLADPDAHEEGYDELPLGALLSLCQGLDELLPRLAAVTCPVLIMTSRVDHVVPPVSSDVLAEHVSGPVERVWLDRSYHLPPLDHDRAEVEVRTVEFARKVAAE